MTVPRLKWIAVLLVAATVYFLVAEVDSLSCDRGRGTCTVTHRKIYRSASQSFRIADMTGAELAELPSTGSEDANEGRGLRVVVLTREGPIPLMNHATGIGVAEMEEQAAAIRGFAADPSAKSLTVEHANHLVAFIVATFAFVVAGAVALAS